MARSLRKYGEVPNLTRPSLSALQRPSNESIQESGSEADFLDEEDVNLRRSQQAKRLGGPAGTGSAPPSSADGIGGRVSSRELMPPPPRPALVSSRGGTQALQPNLFSSQEVSRSLPDAPQTGLGTSQTRQSRLDPRSAPFVPASQPRALPTASPSNEGHQIRRFSETSDRRQATDLSTGSGLPAFQTPTNRQGRSRHAPQSSSGEHLASSPAQDEFQRSRTPSVLESIPSTGRRLSLPPRPRQSAGSQNGGNPSAPVTSPFFLAPSRPASSVSNAPRDQMASDQGPSGRMSSDGRRKARR